MGRRDRWRLWVPAMRRRKRRPSLDLDGADRGAGAGGRVLRVEKAGTTFEGGLVVAACVCRNSTDRDISAIALIIGFALGYGVRAWISYQRHQAERRRRGLF
jgi:hypothetical protein